MDNKQVCLTPRIHSLLVHESYIGDWLDRVFKDIFMVRVWSNNFLSYPLKGILVLHEPPVERYRNSPQKLLQDFCIKIIYMQLQGINTYLFYRWWVFIQLNLTVIRMLQIQEAGKR